MGKGGGLQLHEDVALEHAVVEDEVHEEVLFADEEALLPGFEAEAVAHFHEEILKAIEQSVFDVGFTHDIAGAEAEELEDVGITDDLGGLEGFGPGVGGGREDGFVL